MARHRSGLDSNSGVISMPADQNADLFWNGGTLASLAFGAGIVDNANGRYLLRNIQSDNPGHRQPPTVRITGQDRPDRGTIGGSGAKRDYRMSTSLA